MRLLGRATTERAPGLELLAEAQAAAGRATEAMFESAPAPLALRGVGREDAAQHELELAREQFAALGALKEEHRAATTQAERAPVERPVLSVREVEVLRHIAEGLSNKEIAARLTLSEHTVHRRVANILVKLRLSSRGAAVAYAAKQGLIE